MKNFENDEFVVSCQEPLKVLVQVKATGKEKTFSDGPAYGIRTICNAGDHAMLKAAVDYYKSVDESVGPLPYGAVVEDGKLYPEFVEGENRTVYERDLLKVAVLDGVLIRKALLALAKDGTEAAEEAWLVLTRFKAAHDGVVDEGGFDYWEAQ